MKKSILALVLVFGACTTFAGETKVGGELYPQWSMDFSQGAENYNSFELARSYVTLTSDLNEQTSVRITVDLRSTSGFSGYDIILKYGYVNWNPTFTKTTSFRFGLHQTMYIDYLNKMWGRRYVEKTASDLYKYMTSSDLGVSSKTIFGSSKSTALHLGVYNGTSYSDVEDLNNNKDINAVLVTKPIKSDSKFKNSTFIGQIYWGTQNVDLSGGLDADDYQNNIVSIGGILDYDNTFSFGLDANWHSLGTGSGSPDLDQSAISLFATYFLGKNADENSILKNMNVFGRMDFVEPDSDTPDDGLTAAIIGLECVTSKNLKTSLNVRMVSYEDSSISTNSYLFFNAFIKI